MKKIILLLLLTICLSLSACGQKSTEQKEPEQSVTDAQVSGQISSENTEIVPEPEPENDSGNTPETKPETKNEEEAPQPETPPVTSVNLETLRSEIVSSLNISDVIDIDVSAMSDLYGIEASMAKQAAGFVTMDGTFPHEIIMTEATNAENAEKIADLLENRLNEVKNQSKSYDAENFALAQKCKVLKKGNFVALFLSPDQSSISAVYAKYVK